jgi:hypothetical protein
MTREPKQKKASSKTAETAEAVGESSVPPNEMQAPPHQMLVAQSFQSENYRTIYSNYAKVGITQWDFTLIFGMNIEKNAQNVYEEQVAIKFSPQYFKSLVGSLTESLRQWEQAFGEIQSGLGQSPNLQGMQKAFGDMKSALTDLEQRQKD